MNRFLLAALAAAVSAVLAVPTSPAFALDAGDWLARVRGIWVDPIDSSSGISPGLATAKIGVDSAPTGELDFTHMFTENIGAELILAIPVHDLQGKGTISGLGKIGDTYLLPPVLTAQYHFLPKGKIRPYVGVGINYTVFFNEDASTSLNTALGGPTKVRLGDSVGPAGQAGVDIDLTPDIFLNFDVKYVSMSTDVTLTTGSTVRTATVDIDPIIIGIGVGTHF